MRQDFEKEIHAVTSVAWGRGEFRHHIALSTSNGQILLFNIDNTGANMPQSLVRFKDSKRAINSLSFAPNMNNVMMSAGADGSVKLWDLRTNRKRPSAMFEKPGDVARDVQCSPFDGTQFAAIYDSGAIQRWDIRNPQFCNRRINAHSGNGLSLDWHKEYDYIVSGGRDKQIQIWNMASESRKPERVIISSEPVSKVRWQFDLQHSTASSKCGVLNTDIATCSMSPYDHSIYVWNPRRPFIPRYVIEEHTNSVSDIFWRNNQAIWSISKDKSFMQHNLAGRDMAIKEMPAHAIAWDQSSNFTLVIQDKHEEQYVQETDEELALPSSLRVGPSPGIKMPRNPIPYPNKASFNQRIYTIAWPGWEENSFKFCAENYVSSFLEPTLAYGSPQSNQLVMACLRNSEVASLAGKFRTAQTWRVIGDIIEREKQAFLKFPPTKQAVMGSLQPFTSRITESLKGQSSNEVSPLLRPAENSIQSLDSPSQSTPVERPSSRARMETSTSETQVGDIEVGQKLLSSSDEPDITGSSMDTASPEKHNSGATYTQLTSRNQSIHGRDAQELGEMQENAMSSAPSKSSPRTNISSLSVAFTDDSATRSFSRQVPIKPKKTSAEIGLSAVDEILNPAYSSLDDFNNDSISPENHKYPKDLPSSSCSIEVPVIVEPREHTINTKHSSLAPPADPLAKRYQDYLATISYPWSAKNMIQQAAEHALLQGDIQLCAIFGMLFSPEYAGLFPDPSILEEWVTAYIDILRRHDMRTICAEIIKVSSFESIRERGQIETSLDIVCHRCSHPLIDNIGAGHALGTSNIGFWYCAHCHNLLEGCILCTLPTKGLAVSVFGCGHTMHPECLDQWIQDASKEMSEVECPSGCQSVLTSEQSRYP